MKIYKDNLDVDIINFLGLTGVDETWVMLNGLFMAHCVSRKNMFLFSSNIFIEHGTEEQQYPI